MFHQWENAPQRANKDTKRFRKNSQVWFWGVEVVGSGAIAGLTGGILWNRNALQGWQVGLITFGVFVGGFFLIYGLVFLWNLFRAPYHQRNEARAKVDQYEREHNKPVSKYYDQIAKDKTNTHWENLANLSQEIAIEMTTPFSIDQRYLGIELDNRDDGIRTLIFSLDNNEIFDYRTSPDYIKNDVDWMLYDYLQIHLKEEYPDWQNQMETLKNTVIYLHNKLHDLSQVATNITNEWQIIIGVDWSSNVSVNAGDLSSRVREAIIPMQNDVMAAHIACWKAIKPIRVKLFALAKRRTFKGECPACP